MRDLNPTAACNYVLDRLPQRVLLSADVAMEIDVLPIDAGEEQVYEATYEIAPADEAGMGCVLVDPACEDYVLPEEEWFAPGEEYSGEEYLGEEYIDEEYIGEEYVGGDDLVYMTLDDTGGDDPIVRTCGTVWDGETDLVDGQVLMLDGELDYQDVDVMLYSLGPAAETGVSTDAPTQPEDRLPVATILDGHVDGVSQGLLSSQDQALLGQPAEVLG